MGLFDKIKKLNVFSGFFSIDEDFFDELEENLILADMGMDTTLEAVEELRGRVNYTEKVIKDRKIDIADRYESYVGRDFMTKERLKELESILAGGEAANISEAREVYYEKNRNKR